MKSYTDQIHSEISNELKQYAILVQTNGALKRPLKRPLN